MRCFQVAASPLSRSSASPRARPPSAAAAAHQPQPRSAAPSDDGESGNGDGDALSPRSSRSAATSQASPGTFNLLAREYTLAVHTQSYAEIWSKIHTLSASSVVDASRDLEIGESAARSSSAHLADEVLRPDRGSVDEALRSARPGRLTGLVSDYFDSSEHTSRLCIHLHRCVDRAKAIYGPLIDLLDILPTPAATAATTPISPNLMPSARPQQNQHQIHRHHPQHLSQSQCERAFDVLQEFSAHENPFPAPRSAEDDGAGFAEIRRGYVELRRQLDRRLRRARARARLLSRTASGSALCLVVIAVGITVSGLVLAVHALPALAAAAPLLGAIRLQPADPLAARRRQLKERVTQLDAAARGTYVLNNSLDTIERLVARLHATVESDRELVSLGLSRSRGDYHPIEQVVRQLRRSRQGLLEQLRDLEEHVCLCFAAINRARQLLLQHIHCHHTHYRGRAAASAADTD